MHHIPAGIPQSIRQILRRHMFAAMRLQPASCLRSHFVSGDVPPVPVREKLENHGGNHVAIRFFPDFSRILQSLKKDGGPVGKSSRCHCDTRFLPRDFAQHRQLQTASLHPESQGTGCHRCPPGGQRPAVNLPVILCRQGHQHLTGSQDNPFPDRHAAAEPVQGNQVLHPDTSCSSMALAKVSANRGSCSSSRTCACRSSGSGFTARRQAPFSAVFPQNRIFPFLAG